MSDAYYAWRIDKDNLAESLAIGTNETGVAGPYNAPENLLNYLSSGRNGKAPEGVKAYKFRMYDDDGILYYTGHLAVIMADGAEPDADALMSPLYDFGGPGAGATLIKYANHPKWTIEY